DQRQWRAQALQWLNDDLVTMAAWIKQNRLDARYIENLLAFWRRDPDLAIIRDEKQIRALADEEQAAVHRLWNEVADLERMVKASYSITQHTGYVSRSFPERTHRLKLSPGFSYRIELTAPEIRGCLRILNNLDEALAETTASALGRPTSLVFTPPADGIYQLVATTQDQTGSGAYAITIDDFGPAKE